MSMPIDRDAALAMAFPDLDVDVERGSLRAFAGAVGERRGEYVDVAAARAGGHRDLLVPPTYFFSLELHAESDPFAFLDALGVDLTRVLHGEQRFTYATVACAGDRLRLRRRIVDVTVKKGGTMELLTKQTDVLDDREQIVAQLESVLVISGDR